MDEEAWRTEEERAEFAERPIRFLMKLHPYRFERAKRGQSIHLAVKLPEWFARWIERVKERAGGVYDIKSDVVRDALWIGLRVLGHRYKLPEWRAEIKLQEIANEIEEDNLIKTRVADFMTKLEQLQKIDKERAKKHLGDYLSEIDKIEDSWRKGKYLEELSKYSVVKEME